MMDRRIGATVTKAAEPDAGQADDGDGQTNSKGASNLGQGARDALSIALDEVARDVDA